MSMPTDDVLARLAQVIEQRKHAEPDKSYVAKLFSKGLDAILKKVGEEATETVMAANLPVMVQKGVVEGDAVHGLLPGGQAIAAIRKLESCEELIGRIVNEASARLEALGAAHLTQNSGVA